MLCSREQAIELMLTGRDPREILIPELNESPEEKKAREELIHAIEHKEMTFFHFSCGLLLNSKEMERVKKLLMALGYPVLNGGSGTGNAVLFDNRKMPGIK